MAKMNIVATLNMVDSETFRIRAEYHWVTMSRDGDICDHITIVETHKDHDDILCQYDRWNPGPIGDYPGLSYENELYYEFVWMEW